MKSTIKWGYLSYCIIPAAMTLLGALLYLPSWYYSLFKVVMVFDAVISIILFSSSKQNNEIQQITKLLCSAILISIIASLGIVSQFFIPGGFPKRLWIYLDFIFAGAKCLQFFVLSNQFE